MLNNNTEKVSYQDRVITNWILQNAVRETLCKPYYDFSKGEKPPRLFWCGRVPVSYPQTKNIEVHKSLESQKAFYKNLQSCDSVWICPLCSLRISSQRVKKIQAAMDYWGDLSECHQTLFVTSTMPHTINQSLHHVRSSFMKARRRMHRQKKLKRTPEFVPFFEICENFGIVGTITGIETTYGKNGWHYHSHEIYFMSWPLSAEAIGKLKVLLVEAWKRALIAEKVAIENDSAFFKRSIDIEKVTADSNIASYVSKTGGGWTASHELVKSQAKKGHIGSKSIFDIALEIAKNINKKVNQRLFREYAKEMTGKRQLFCSKGLASLVHYDEIEDEDLQEDQELSEYLGTIKTLDWDIIRRKELRGEVLEICISSGFDAAIKFIRKMGCMKLTKEIKNYA